jgi:hypothetical protein
MSGGMEEPAEAGITPEGAVWGGPVPVWFWAVAGVCLAWNALVVLAYGAAMMGGAGWLAPMPPAVADFLGHVPFWVRGAGALGVWGSVAGAVLMLARLRHAAVAYALSFAGAVGALAWPYAHGALALGPGFVPMAGVVLGAILVQLWFARKMFWRAVLR